MGFAPDGQHIERQGKHRGCGRIFQQDFAIPPGQRARAEQPGRHLLQAGQVREGKGAFREVALHRPRKLEPLLWHGATRCCAILVRDQEAPVLRGLAGKQRGGIHDLLRLQRGMVAKNQDIELRRTPEQGNQEEDKSRRRLPESRIVREAYRLATDGTTRGMDGRKSLLNREGNGKICFLCMNLQKKTCLI